MLQRVDDAFDPFPGPDQPPGQYDRLGSWIGYHTSPGQCGAVCDRGHLGGVDLETLTQPSLGRLRHDHDVVRQGHYIVEHRPLMRSRVGQDRVRDDDGRDAETSQDLEQLVSVGASVEAVFVLYQRDVVLVQGFRAREHRMRDPLVKCPTTGSWGDFCAPASRTCTTPTPLW